MPVETAEMLFFAIVVVMAAVWLIGTRFAFSRFRAHADTEEQFGESDAGMLTGEALLEKTGEALEKKIAARLAAASSPLGIPLVKITECTSKQVTFERQRGARGYGLVTFGSGTITLTREGGGTRVRYEVDLSRFLSVMRLVTSLVCFGYGGLFVIAAPIVLWYLVVHHEDPNVRWQTLQTLQMVHGVWPPFLMGSLVSRARTTTTAYFDALLENLKFTA